MSGASSYSVGTVSSGDGALLWAPKFKPALPKFGVLHAHGAGGYAQNAIDPTGLQSSLYGGVVNDGSVLFAGDYGGPANWGASNAMVRMTAAYNYLQTQPNVKPGKVVLMGGSMGALCCLNWAAANPDKVACVVGIIPVINLNDIVVNNRGGYGAEASAAYGTWSESTYGATYNPKTMAGLGKYNGLPILLFYGTTDTLCIPAETQAFGSLVGLNATLVPVAGGHDYGTWAGVNHQQVWNFIKQFSS